MQKDKNEENKPTKAYTVGAIALAFLIIGYQTALFIHKAAVSKIISNSDHPDTVFVYTTEVESKATRSATGPKTVRKNSVHSESAKGLREKYGTRRYENFSFNPNDVSKDELMRLGFTSKQAQAIDNYRKAGGRFLRKEDFAKSFVVEDSVYNRLEPYITIPLTDINSADSTEFDGLPGIGPYYASKMVAYRELLGGYSFVEQLLEIPRFDKERFEKIRDLITVGQVRSFPLWKLPEDSLALHPYLNKSVAHGIVLFRNNNPRSEWSVASLRKAGVLSQELADKLERCNLD